MTETASFADWHKQGSQRVEQRLTRLLAAAEPPPLAAAMKDGVLAGGKRLRPMVLFAVAEEANSIPKAALDAACALELIHCYSLVHDDLPCMDDDDMRRGKPACHKLHGENMALLAGDCLQSLAFATLAASALPRKAMQQLAHAAGIHGMGGGQAIDLARNIRDEAALESMHRLKTGALFNCALQLGLLCRKHATADMAQAIDSFGCEFGLLFQIANDIQDEEQDRSAGRLTYATMLTPSTVQARARVIKQRALAAVDGLFPRLAQLTHAVHP